MALSGKLSLHLVLHYLLQLYFVICVIFMDEALSKSSFAQLSFSYLKDKSSLYIYLYWWSSLPESL